MLNNLPIFSVLFCINSFYARQLVVLITSIQKNNPNKNFNFYIFHTDLSKHDEVFLKELENQKCKLIFKKVDNTFLSNFKISDSARQDISLDTYSRYLAADLLPELDKILYLDTDTIVNGNLSPLYEIDLDTNWVGGIEERCLYKDKYVFDKLNFSKNEIYINAGVLLMNLKKMREDHFFEIFSTISEKCCSLITYSDQDILNLTARGKIKKLDCIYNMTPAHINDLPSKKVSAVIVHYTGKYKPWTLGTYCNDLNSLWLKYYNQSFLAKRQKVKVFCIYHTSAYRFENDMISPIQTGNYGLYNGMDMLQSCDGIQIDNKNKNYGELTAWYWVWKNYLQNHPDLEYVGFCHYRRMLDYTTFTQKSPFLQGISIQQFIDSFNNKYSSDLVYNAIKDYDIVLPRKYSIVPEATIEEQYLEFHPQKDLEILKQIIIEDYPDYIPAMNKVMNSKSAYFCLLFTMKKDIFIQFMEWSFDILSKLESKSDWSKYTSYFHIRVPAFLIERFFNVWLLHNSPKYGWKILERDGYIFYEYLNDNKSNSKYELKLFNCLPIFKKNNRGKNIKFYILGLPLFKKKITSNKIKYDFFGLPCWKTRIKGNIKRSYLFGFIPLFKRIKK